jgi:AcrR family transcriptional regulator
VVRRALAAVRGAPRTKRRVRLETDQRRAQLLALARKAFSDRSYDEVSIDDLAREAGISKGLLYHYFPTKRDLYVAGLSEIANELVDAVTRVGADAELPLTERVRRGLDAYLDHITRHARAFVSLMRGGIGSDPEVANVVEGVRRRMFETILQDSPFGPLLAGDPRLRLTIRGWIGFVETTSIDWCGEPQISREELRELLVSVLFEILRAVSPRAHGAAVAK